MAGIKYLNISSFCVFQQTLIEGIQDYEKIRILREQFTKNGNE